MFKKIFTSIVTRRNFWRRATFSEIADLYATRIMRTIAINVGAAFMSVFMLKNGYSIVAVSLFWAAYFGFKVIIMLPLAQSIARRGARIAIIASNFLYIPSMIAFIFLPELGLWALLLTGLFQATSAAMYDLAHTVNFSRVKSSDAAGNQVAMMNIFEQLAKGISPLIGGLLALFFDPRAAIAVSAIFFLFAAFPLLQSKDTHSKGFTLSPKGFPWKMATRSLLIELPIGFDVYASGSAWSIFLASVIFVAGGNQVYAEIGALTTIVFIISIAVTRMYGKVIDKNSGGSLLFWAAAGNAFVHLLRGFVRNPIMVLGVNTAKETAVAGYSMAFLRGKFDIADRSGYRVFYIGLATMAINIGSAAAALLLAAIVAIFSSANGFVVFYLLTAAVTSLIMLARFRVYRQA